MAKQKLPRDSVVSRALAERSRGVTRRDFVQGIAASTALLAFPGPIKAAPAILKGIRGDDAFFNDALFPLGVASGDPSPHSVVLWSRLAPEPLDGGGMSDRPMLVQWTVALDEGMAKIIREGIVMATAANGHAVHVEVHGLPSNQWFYYRFTALGQHTRVGRTRTFPGERDRVDQMRFGLASCQNFKDGFYTAWRDMAGQNLDFVIHVGDYIYENGPAADPIAEGRNHKGPEIFSVEDYRNRYALYRLDPDLQDAHARFPFLLTWDDHEVDNNYAGLIPEQDSPTQDEAFRERRRAAYWVYRETMPLGSSSRLVRQGNRLRLFRRIGFGDLASIHLLDTRQFRTDQPAADGFGSTDPDITPAEAWLLEQVFGEKLFDRDGILAPAATLLGPRQEAWLIQGLKTSRAHWNILAQQVMLTRWNLVETARLTVAGQVPPEVKTALAGLDNIFNMDAWDGYQQARRRLFRLLARLRPNNPMVLSGDIHSAWGANLLENFDDPLSDTLATEFVCTSISSTFASLDPRPVDAAVRPGLADNPHIEYFNGLFRGYCLCEVDRERWRTSYRAVGSPASVLSPDTTALVPFPDSPVETDAVLSIASAFNRPGSGARLETEFSRPSIASGLP